MKKKLKEFQKRNIDSMMKMVESMDIERFKKTFVSEGSDDLGSLEMLVKFDESSVIASKKKKEHPAPKRSKTRAFSQNETQEIELPLTDDPPTD